MISTLFLPPNNALFILIFLSLYLETVLQKQVVGIFNALLFSFILPIVAFFYLRRKGRIVNEDATIKEERTTPYLFGIAFSIAGLILSLFFALNSVTTSLWFCYITNVVILIIINKFWKISAHAIGVSGPVSVLFFLFGLTGLIFVLVILIVGWARLKLKVHTPAQVICGSIYGFGMTYLQLVVYHM